MLKYLLLALLIIWLFYSPALRRQLQRRDTPPPPDKPPADPTTPQVMRTCAHCGVHFPENEGHTSVQSGRTLYFCSADHLRAGPRSS